SQLVATHEVHKDSWTPEKVFENAGENDIFVVTWGPLVAEHIKLIRHYRPRARILYYAQSFGWNVRVPRGIPIACVSRFVMSQCALYAPENFCTYIPPPLSPHFKMKDSPRDIDILVHTRKQNNYCLKQLLPALQAQNYKIQVLDSWLEQDQLAALLNRTKIFLYVTELHKAGLFRRLPGEGFGLPALEAAACGALVGSNLLGGVTDFLTPGENCIKLQNGDLDFDLRQISAALKHFNADELDAKNIATEYSPNVIQKKWGKLFESLWR
ncbi:MAG: hypothetical protein AAB588_04195, partial [Patescibacteria group bacterium]